MYTACPSNFECLNHNSKHSLINKKNRMLDALIARHVFCFSLTMVFYVFCVSASIFQVLFIHGQRRYIDIRKFMSYRTHAHAYTQQSVCVISFNFRNVRIRKIISLICQQRYSTFQSRNSFSVHCTLISTEVSFAY